MVLIEKLDSLPLITSMVRGGGRGGNRHFSENAEFTQLTLFGPLLPKRRNASRIDAKPITKPIGNLIGGHDISGKTRKCKMTRICKRAKSGNLESANTKKQSSTPPLARGSVHPLCKGATHAFACPCVGGAIRGINPTPLTNGIIPKGLVGGLLTPFVGGQILDDPP